MGLSFESFHFRSSSQFFFNSPLIPPNGGSSLDSRHSRQPDAASAAADGGSDLNGRSRRRAPLIILYFVSGFQSRDEIELSSIDMLNFRNVLLNKRFIRFYEHSRYFLTGRCFNRTHKNTSILLLSKAYYLKLIKQF